MIWIHGSPATRSNPERRVGKGQVVPGHGSREDLPEGGLREFAAWQELRVDGADGTRLPEQERQHEDDAAQDGQPDNRQES